MQTYRVTVVLHVEAKDPEEAEGLVATMLDGHLIDITEYLTDYTILTPIEPDPPNRRSTRYD